MDRAVGKKKPRAFTEAEKEAQVEWLAQIHRLEGRSAADFRERLRLEAAESVRRIQRERRRG